MSKTQTDPVQEEPKPYMTLAQFLVSSLLTDEADVQIRERIERGNVQLWIEAADKYRGRLIGKGGHTVRSIRTVMNLANYEGIDMTSSEIHIVQ